MLSGLTDGPTDGRTDGGTEGGARLRAEPDGAVRVLRWRVPGLLFKAWMGIGGAVSQGLMMSLILFPVAGTTDWPAGWAYVAAWSLWVLVMCFVASTEILVERFWPLHEIRRISRSDVVFGSFIFPVIGGWLVLMPYERFHLDDPRPPLTLAIIGFVLLNVGWVWITLSVRDNKFASPLVKLQRERGHEVIDSGSYSVVRHPMYLGASLLMVGVPLWLRSWLGVGVGAFAILGIALRIRIEERVLRDGLAGYEDYTRRVKYRLVPHIW